MHGTATRGRHGEDDGGGGGGGSGVEVAHGGGALASSKNERRNKKKKEKKGSMTKCENTKNKMISSCTNLAGDHETHQRDELQGFVGEEEKQRRGRREKEGEET